VIVPPATLFLSDKTAVYFNPSPPLPLGINQSISRLSPNKLFALSPKLLQAGETQSCSIALLRSLLRRAQRQQELCAIAQNAAARTEFPELVTVLLGESRSFP
jgi:hypothetical protein